MTKFNDISIQHRHNKRKYNTKDTNETVGYWEMKLRNSAVKYNTVGRSRQSGSQPWDYNNECDSAHGRKFSC